MIRIAGLIFARMLGACMQIPFLGGQMIPGQLKTGIPIMFTAFLYPILSAGVNPGWPFVNEMIDLSGSIFTLAMQLSAPVVVAMLLTDLTLGVVNRTAPNVQVFWLGMPIKTLGGLVVVFFAIGYATETFTALTITMAATLKRTIILLAGGTG